jgi:hypothetical protein
MGICQYYHTEVNQVSHAWWYPRELRNSANFVEPDAERIEISKPAG